MIKCDNWFMLRLRGYYLALQRVAIKLKFVIYVLPYANRTIYYIYTFITYANAMLLLIVNSTVPCTKYLYDSQALNRNGYQLVII